MTKTIGLDIGGTKIQGAVIDEKGEILKTYRLETCAREGKDKVLDNISKIIDFLKTDDIKAVGVGTPGFIDSENGIVTFAGNIDGWTGLNLKKEIEKRSSLPVFIENDANIALVCEKWLGSGKGFNDIVMITIGTGLGGAVYNKKMGLLSGSNFQGAELGHLILHPNGEYCTCGQSGCAESYCSGTAIVRHYEELTRNKLEGQEIFELVKTDDNAKKVIDRFTSDLAWFLTSLRNIFDPELIIIGGGVINSKDYWWKEVLEKFDNYCHLSEKIEIKPAKYLNDAGVIGAGRIAMERLKNE
ncbi:MAG: ROK family protein [Anaerococcus hydrogenalis]|mgnify:CR=1 FL=1|uniref:ROK family protein n=1 Tax=Anaerococcus hydrogenalis TaxID=33029 RepID=UPI0028FDDD67|nr:ROK family protein [Anaerococcus hydrogenalis]MDU3152843.1 ROK family protein [Anaerococcus hydrogenalis]MDU3687809.1 ROK family protein [Anaerococcus hydrogenalis]